MTLREFKAGVPPLGPGGEAAKEYIFNRVDQLVNADSKLDQQVRMSVQTTITKKRPALRSSFLINTLPSIGCHANMGSCV